jgi:flagellar hook-length control protein FliK
MNLPGIQNALAALAAQNPAGGAKTPSSGTMRVEPQASFRQALSQEVAQRQNAFQPPFKPQSGAKPQPLAKPQQAAAPHAPQQAARPQAGDKAQASGKVDKTDNAEARSTEAAAASPDAAPAAPAAPAAQAGEAKPEEYPAQDGTASLADIPGAPQAALMMQLMNTAQAPAVAPAVDAAPALDTAVDGKAAGKDAAAQAPVDLRAIAGKEAKAEGGQGAAADAAASTDLHAAFGKTMSEAGQQAAQAMNAAQAEAPAAHAAPAALAALQAAVQSVHAPAAQADRLTPAVGTPAWDQALGQKIVWMVRGGEQSATLTMNPPDLGPMQVVLSVTNNQATVDFMSAQPEVRQALESALPRLREMMGESGVQLGQANVSAGSQQQFAGFESQNRGGGRANGKEGKGIEDGAPPLRQGIVRMARDGVVDTFA